MEPIKYPQMDGAIEGDPTPKRPPIYIYIIWIGPAFSDLNRPVSSSIFLRVTKYSEFLRTIFIVTFI